MKVAIIGGGGKMGQWFARFLLKEGIKVVISDKNKEKLLKLADMRGVDIAHSNIEAVKDAEVVLIGVPIENFAEVVREIAPSIEPKQVVMDITSIKQFPVETMHKYIKAGKILGTHPMFGPNTPEIKYQNFVLTPAEDAEEVLAAELAQWLKDRGFNVTITSATRHDELMATALGLSHFIGIVAGDSLLSLADVEELKEVGGTSFQLLVGLINNVISEEAEFYATLQTSLPSIERVEEIFCEKSKMWADIIRNKDKKEFIHRMESIKERIERR